jgi:hypothetical protein
MRRILDYGTEGCRFDSCKVHLCRVMPGVVVTPLMGS